MRTIVHGGAGTAPAEPNERLAVLEGAADAGADAQTPTEAVCAAIRRLESAPRFNAGVGSAVQSDGYIRTDAGLMTDDRSVGAAAGMPGVEHAIDVARAVKDETPHVLVAGVHAVDLAETVGVETTVDLWTDRTRQRWDDLDTKPPDELGDQLAWVTERFGGDPAGRDETDHDTVGAVATDGDRIAAGTSTGGRWLALAGRVGDVPQVGSGFYCTPAGGVSATGAGEDIARQTLARSAADRLDAGDDAQRAVEAAIDDFDEAVEGTAGLIALTPDGDAGAAYSSEAMQTAVSGTL